jgi:di/tricarboxylate transporter
MRFGHTPIGDFVVEYFSTYFSFPMWWGDLKTPLFEGLA